MFVTVGPDNDTGFRKHLEELSLILDSPSKFVLVREKGYNGTIKEIKKNLESIGWKV